MKSRERPSSNGEDGGLSGRIDGIFATLFRSRPARLALSLAGKYGVSKGEKRTLMYLTLLGLVLRLGIFLLMPSYFPRTASELRADAKGYDQSATGALDGDGFNIYWQPGYPVFLAAVYYVAGHEILVPILISVALSVATGYVAYLICLRLFSERRVGYISFLLMSVQPTLVMESPQIMSDTLGLFLFSAVILMGVEAFGNGRPALFFGIGLVMGVLFLVRPNYVGLGPVFLLYVIYLARRKGALETLRRGIPFVIAGTLVVGPWLYHTWSETGSPVVSTNGGVNFYIGNSENATGRFYEPEDLNYSQGWRGNESESLEGGEEGYERGWKFISENPEESIKLNLKKIVLLVFLPQRMPWELFDHDYDPALEYAHALNINLWFVFIELIGVCGVLAARRENLGHWKFFLPSILYFYAVPVMFFVGDRFIMPIIFVFGLFGSYYIFLMLVKAGVVSLPKNAGKASRRGKKGRSRRKKNPQRTRN